MDLNGPQLDRSATWERVGESPVTVQFWYEPMSAKAAETNYGLTGVDRVFLAFFDASVTAEMREGDVIRHDGVAMTVRAVKRFNSIPLKTTEAVIEARTRAR